MIFLLMLRREWEGSQVDPIARSGEDGFVHCCDEGQVEGVRERYFPADAEVVAVAVDPTRLAAETRYEPGAGGEPERFPHVYGDIDRSAVVSARPV